MKELTCYVVDDEDFSAIYIEELIEKANGVRSVGYETRPLVALQKLLSGEVIADIVFLDIQMPRLSGIEFAKRLGSLANIVFVTAKDIYPLKAFEIGAMDYLLKPVDEDRFKECIERLIKRIGPAKQQGLTERLIFKYGLNGQLAYIAPTDILYVEADSNYAVVSCTTGQQIKCLMKMTDMVEKLGSNFMQVHRSFIVRLDQVASHHSNRIVLSDKTVIPLSRTFRKEFTDRMKDY